MFNFFKLLITLLIIHNVFSISTPKEDPDNDDSVDDTQLVDEWTKRQNSSLATKSSLNTNNKPVEEQGKCNCVKYYNCLSADSSNSTKNPKETLGVVDISNPISSNGTKLNVNKGCAHYFEICCKVQNSKNYLLDYIYNASVYRPLSQMWCLHLLINPSQT
jgi:hypothetical protein